MVTVLAGAKALGGGDMVFYACLNYFESKINTVIIFFRIWRKKKPILAVGDDTSSGESYGRLVLGEWLSP